MIKRISILLVAVFLLQLLPATYAKETTPATFTAQCMKTSQQDNFQYWLYTPADPTPNMPLIVYLHGGSGKGEDLSLITGVEGFPKYLQDGRIGDLRAYVVMPQLATGKKGWPDASASIMALINQTVSTYGLDGENVSLTGHSMGGTGTWSVALSYPNTFARIAPLSGSVKNTTININKLKNIPIWAVVGSADTIVDPEASITMNQALAESGNMRLTVMEGATHFDVPNAYLDQELAILDWLIDGKFSADGKATASFADAVQLSDSVKLLQDAQIRDTLTRDIYLDLNGCNLTGSLNCNGYQLLCKDSKTDDYTVLDGVCGSIKLTADGVAAQEGYLMLPEESGYSFHRLYMQLEVVSFRPREAGIYYQGRFRGDERIRAAVDYYGIAFGVDQAPDFSDGTYTRLTDTDRWADLQTGTLVKSIMCADNSSEENRKNGEMWIQGQPYLQLKDGTLVQGNSWGISLRYLLEGSALSQGIDSCWSSLTDTQRSGLMAFAAEFRQAMADWVIPNIRKALG